MSKPVSVLIRTLSIAIQLVYVKSYIHYLTVIDLGYCFYLTTLSYAINALLLVPADYYQQARLATFHDGVFPLGSFLALNVRLLLLAAGLALLLGVPTCVAGKLTPLDLGLIFCLAVSLYLSTAFRNCLNNRGHHLFTGWMLLMEAGLKVLSFLLFMASGMPHVSAFILSTVSAFLVEIVCLATFFYQRVPFTLARTADLSFRAMVGTSSIISFSAVCNWLQLQGYRIVYVWLGMADVSGLYAAVSNLGIMGMNASSTVFAQILLPKVYSSRGGYIMQYMKYALLLCLVVLLGYVALGRVLLLVLAKKVFAPYAGLMLLGILVEAGNFLISAATAYLTIRHLSINLFIANIGGLAVAAAGVCLCLIWYRHNPYLLGVTLVCSQFVIGALLFYKSRQSAASQAVHG